MKLKFQAAICCSIMLMFVIFASPSGMAQENAESAKTKTLIPENFKVNDDLTPFIQGIKESLKQKDDTNTVALIKTLKSLLKAKANESFVCGYGGLTADPLSYPRVLFDAILNELITREGKPVSQLMQELLLTEKLGENDKRKIWTELKRRFGNDFPVVLEATNPSQNRKYLLHIDTGSKVEVEVKKGDTLIRIAKKNYPNLSVWSGVDIISFMNGFYGHEQIKAGSKFNIFPYRIIKDDPADESESSSKKNTP